MTKQPESRRWSTLAAIILAVAMALVLFVVVSRAQNAPLFPAAKPGANSGDLLSLPLPDGSRHPLEQAR